MKVDQTVALITGGASGLGEACVRRMVAAGAKTAILDFDADKGTSLSEELGSSAVFIQTDVADPVSAEAAVEGARKAFGSIHALLNCAGIATPGKLIHRDGPIPLETLSRVIQVNLVGTLNMIRLAAFQMKDNPPGNDGERGVVINTSSVAASEGQIGQAAYSASKAGVAGMTLTLAREFADIGIRVVSIAPGLFNTPMMARIPEKVRAALAKMPPFPKRLGQPEEFAMLVKNIIENPMLNGETIRLDGALRMSHQ